MAITRTKSVNPILTDEEIKELEQAEKMPITFDEDCPEMTDEMLSQFKRMNSVNIALSASDMIKVRNLGTDYKKVLSKLLSMALSDSEMLKKCI